MDEEIARILDVFIARINSLDRFRVLESLLE